MRAKLHSFSFGLISAMKSSTCESHFISSSEITLSASARANRFCGMSGSSFKNDEEPDSAFGRPTKGDGRLFSSARNEAGASGRANLLCDLISCSSLIVDEEPDFMYGKPTDVDGRGLESTWRICGPCVLT